MKLRDWRTANGLSQAELASIAGLSQQAISAFESGVVPRGGAMVAIYAATGAAVAPNDFYALPEIGARSGEAAE